MVMKTIRCNYLNIEKKIRFYYYVGASTLVT
jgi:hypothetical protein